MVHILHVVHQYLPEYIGGTELYTNWLVAGLRRQNHNVSVVYRREGSGDTVVPRTDTDDAKIWAISTGQITPRSRFLATFADAQVQQSFAQIIDQTQPHVVHIQHLMGLPVSVVEYLQTEKIPYVITLHDFWWICANAQLFTNYDQTICDGPRAYVNCARCAVARAGHPNFWPAIPALAPLLARRNNLLRSVLANAVCLISPSQFVADWYVNQGIPKSTLRVVPHAIPLPDKLPPRVPLHNRPFRFGYIGGLSHQKGVHILLEAFAKLQPNAELWIAGDKDAEPEYVKGLDDQATDNVRFLGRLSRQQVWETLAQVDVIVVPTLWYESFSLIISEAHAMGVPVIASKLGPITDRIQVGVNGLFVPAGDVDALQKAMTKCMVDPILMQTAEGRQTGQGAMDGHTANILDIYETALTQIKRLEER
ncbi:MAG: glycosyltransferase family 4 protein [Chloroflexota bacterium]